MVIPSICGQEASPFSPYMGVNLAISSSVPDSGMNRLPKNASTTSRPEAAPTADSERNSSPKVSP